MAEMTGHAISAILFDKDGTLFDFQATWATVTEAVLDRIAPGPEAKALMAEAGGYDIASGRFRPGSSIVAGAVRDTALLWAPHLPGHGVDEIEDMIAAASEAMTGPATLVPAVPDLPDLLARLSCAGHALGVATHDTAAGAEAHLAAVGALGAFAFVAGYDSGHGLKPGPGMLLAFAAEAGVPPARIAVVGDS